MSENDRRKLRIRLRPEQLDDPEYLLQTLPELLHQQFKNPETAETGFDDEPPFDPTVDQLSNKVADQLIEATTEVLRQAREKRDTVSADEEARIQQMVDARIALLQKVEEIKSRVKGIGMSAEATDKDIVRP